MKIKNYDKWKKWVENNQDPYGKAVINFAQRWGNLMEKAMKNGESLSNCAKRLSHEADIEGITGFMYGAAVAVLATCWEHGEELRRWHNLNVQIGNEGEKANESGGVLNPAVLVISNRRS